MDSEFHKKRIKCFKGNLIIKKYGTVLNYVLETKLLDRMGSP